MKIYTDGSSSPNPGKGGYCLIVTDSNDSITDIHMHYDCNTTNNRMEMEAILAALEKYGNSSFLAPIVYTDSAYSLNSFTVWREEWKNNNWKRSNGKEPENLDLIKKYDDLISQGYFIVLQKIKGHSGELFNELADKKAKEIRELNELLEKGK